MNIKKYLSELDQHLNKVQPNTMDNLLETVFEFPGGKAYGFGFSIVQYKGYTQGVRVEVTGRKNTYHLPKKGSYGVFKGVDEFIKAGFPIVIVQ